MSLLMLVDIFTQVIVLRNSLEFHAKFSKFISELVQPFGQLNVFFLARSHVWCEVWNYAVFFLLADDLHPGFHFVYSLSGLVQILEVVFGEAQAYQVQHKIEEIYVEVCLDAALGIFESKDDRFFWNLSNVLKRPLF